MSTALIGEPYLFQSGTAIFFVFCGLFQVLAVWYSAKEAQKQDDDDDDDYKKLDIHDQSDKTDGSSQIESEDLDESDDDDENTIITFKITCQAITHNVDICSDIWYLRSMAMFRPEIRQALMYCLIIP